MSVSLLYIACFAFNKIFVHLGAFDKYVSSHLAAFRPFKGMGLDRVLLIFFSSVTKVRKWVYTNSEDQVMSPLTEK